MITREFELPEAFEPVYYASLKNLYFQQTKEKAKRLRLSSKNFKSITSHLQESKIYSMRIQEDASLADNKAALDNVA